MGIIHTPVLHPRGKEISVILVSLNTLNLLVGCDIYLEAQEDLDILSLSPFSDAFKMFRKKFGLVHFFKMQTEVPL